MSDPPPYPQDGFSQMPNLPTTPAPPYREEAESPKFTATGFDDINTRQGFIRKVYLILIAQLLVTIGITCVFCLIPVVRNWIRMHSWTYYLSYAVFAVTLITLSCITECRRSFPMNFVSLAIFTLAASYMAGCIAAYHSPEAVLIALILTTLLCLGITLFAIQTKYDFTSCAGYIFAFALAVFLFGLGCLVFYLIFGPNRILQAVYGGLVLILFSALLVFDTQQVIGKRKYELSEEDYIFGALQLYVDILMIFLSIVSLVGGGN